MKRVLTAAATAALLLAGTAVGSAADMAVKARPMAQPLPIVWSWTGFYFGVHVGAGWGTTESTLTGVNDRSSDHSADRLEPAFLPDQHERVPGWRAGWI